MAFVLTSLIVFAIIFQPVLSYGFRSPRGTNFFLIGDTIEIAWDSVDDFVDIYLTAKGFLGSVGPLPPITIAENITNTGSYKWTIPADLDATFTYNSIHMYLINSQTKARGFEGEYFTIYDKKPDPADIPATPTWAKFTAPTGAPETSLIEKRAVNISWDTEVAFIKLTFRTDVNAPWDIIEGFTKNPGTYRWTVQDITTFSLPTKFRLMTNDTAAGDTAVESPAFYTAPTNYPDSFNFSGHLDDEGFLFPTQTLAPDMRENDTVVFTWRKPMPDDYDIQLGVWSETLKDGWITDQTYEDIIRTPTNISYRIGIYKDDYRKPYTFNLLSQSSRSGYPGHRLIMRTEPLTFGDPTGHAETTWTAPAAAFKTSTSAASPTSNATSSESSAASGSDTGVTRHELKLYVGLGVGLGVAALLLFSGIGFFCWRKQQRKKHAIDMSGKAAQTDKFEPFRKPELEGREGARYELGEEGRQPTAEMSGHETVRYSGEMDGRSGVGSVHEMPAKGRTVLG